MSSSKELVRQIYYSLDTLEERRLMVQCLKAQLRPDQLAQFEVEMRAQRDTQPALVSHSD